MKYIGWIFTAIFAVVFSFTQVAHAASTTISTGQTVNGELTGNSKQYQMNVTDDGKLTIELKSKLDLKIHVYDGKGKNVYSSNTLVGDVEHAQTFTQSTYVDKGTYYIEVYQPNAKKGTYTLKTSFKKINSDEYEPNDTQETAQSLVNGQTINSFISYRDTDDWYKIDLVGSGNLNLQINTNTHIGVSLYDEQKKEIFSRQLVAGTDSKQLKKKLEAYLDKGKYYLRIQNEDGYTGIYSVKANVELIKYTENADNNAKELSQSLVLNEKYYGTVSSTDAEDWYKVDLTKPGKLSWTVDANVTAGITAYTSQDVLYKKEIIKGSSSSKKTYKKTVYVEPGTYYLNISKEGTHEGKYTVTANFKSVDINNVNTNNNLLSAQPIRANSSTIHGLITVQNTEDWYTFTLNKSSYVNLTFSGNVYAPVKLLRSDNSLVFNVLYIYASESKRDSVTYKGKLAVGTYYIQTYKMDEYTGPYTLKVSTGSKPTISKVTTPKAGAKKVTGKASVGSTVQVKVGSKTYKAKANSKGVFTVKTSKLKKGAKLTITATNNFGTSAKKTVTVKK